MSPVAAVTISAWIAIAPAGGEASRLSSPWRVVVAPELRSAGASAPAKIRRRARTTSDNTDPRRREAARAFADGEAAFERGDYEDSAERFARAYALSPHPWTLYNQAMSLRHAGDLVAAWRAFGELESIATTEEERSEAARERAAMRDRIAHIELHGPPHAIACVDRDLVRLGAHGRGEWVVAPGEHRLATQAGARAFAVAAGTSVRLEVGRPRRAPRSRGWLVAAILGSAGGLGGGAAAAAIADDRRAKSAAAVGASAAGTALVATIVALTLVESEAKRRRAAPLPCELVEP